MKSRISVMFVIALTAGLAAAQESAMRGGEIVVSASRDYSAAGGIPANVTAITSAEIDQAAAASLVDVLQNLDGIHFRTTSGNASQAQISMRGFGDNSHGRVLLLLDGRKLNHPDMAIINWSQVPLNNVERIEILRGSQTALYGDYALGGVINIVTKKGAREPECSLSALGGSHGLNIQRMGGAGAFGPVSYSVNMERNQSSGYRDRSAYLTWGGGANLGYDVNEWNNLSVSLAYNKMKYEMPGYLTKEQMDENPRQSVFDDDSAESEDYSANLGFNSMLSDTVRFDVNLVYGRKDNVADMASWWSYSDFVIDTYGATPRVTFETELLGHTDTFLAGFDGYWDELDAKRYADPDRMNWQTSADIKKRTMGGYAKNEFSISERLGLDLGARFDQARFDARVSPSGVDDDKVYNATAFSAALLYRLENDSKLFARAGTVYRFPFVDELVSYAGYADDFYGDLAKEKGRNYEIGADVALPANLSAGLTVFLLNMEDEISWNEATGKNDNLDDTRHVGAEARAEWRIADICRLDAWYTYTQARFTNGDNDGNDIPLVPNHKISVAANWFLPFDLTLNATLSYIGEQHLGGDNENMGEKLADYTLVDVGARWTPQALARLGLEAFVGVDNVFDKSYASTGYRGWDADAYYPSPERSFKGGLSCRF